MGLEDRMRAKIRLQGKSRNTFKTYWGWCARFILFLRDEGGRWVHPSSVGREEVERFLTKLAMVDHVSKTTQNVALQSLCYLYREVINQPLENVSAIRAKRPQQARAVIDTSEVKALFDHMSGEPLLVAQMMYASGMRIGEVASLRVKDISFERRQITIYSAKGDKGRHVSFPEVLHPAVDRQLKKARSFFDWDQTHNPNGVSLPDAFRRKSSKAGSSWPWYYLFCSANLSSVEDGPRCRHHRHKGNLSREIKLAAERAKIPKRVTSHVLRHSYATHANEQGVDMRILQQLLGHTDIRTTETYVHANQHRVTESKSPLEEILSNPPRREINSNRFRVVG